MAIIHSTCLVWEVTRGVTLPHLAMISDKLGGAICVGLHSALPNICCLSLRAAPRIELPVYEGHGEDSQGKPKRS